MSLEERKQYIELLEQRDELTKTWDRFKRSITEEVKPFIKTSTQLREEKKQEEKKLFVKTISTGTMKEVHDTLQNVVENIHKPFIDSMSEWIIRFAIKFEKEFESKGWLNKINEINLKEHEKRYKDNKFAPKFIPTKYNIRSFAKAMGVAIENELIDMLEIKYDNNDAIDIKFKPDYKSVANKFAEEQYKIVSDNYLNKNVDKLATIIENKDKNNIGVTNIDTINISHDGPTFSSTVNIKFQDNTEFTVINKSISKVSTLGNWFYQYPTTFHQVKYTDGTAKAMVPEESMVNSWSKENNKIASELINLAKEILSK